MSRDGVSGQVKAVCALFVALGLGSRVWPFLEGGRKFLERFPTEDGYLMLTIARNLALGKGFSTADGTMLTNGTQPLATLLWAPLFAIADGDRAVGVALALVAQVVFGALTAFCLHRLARRLMAGWEHAPTAALLAACVWFGSPLIVPHTMNCLETGLYALLVVLSMSVFHALQAARDRPLGWGRLVGFGALLGVTFWARNDAVFLIAAVCLTHVGSGWSSGAPALRRRFGHALVFGAVSVAVALPWLVYNVAWFGSLIPVSGRAESLDAEFGGNARTMVTCLFEYVTMVVPIPESIQRAPLAVAVAGPVVLLFAWIVARLHRAAAAPEHRAVLLAVSGFTAAIAVYYGLFFGAPWFVSRYLMAVSPFFAMVFAAWFCWLSARVPGQWRGLWLPGLGAGMALVGAGLTAYMHVKHRDHQHFQVVRWVGENVTPETWIGAIQTGTLGFYHDRTINLDGKVNPAAFHAGVAGRRAAYVVDSQVQFLPDWKGILDWMQMPEIAAAFEVVVDDPARNLAVLRRRAR